MIATAPPLAPPGALLRARDEVTDGLRSAVERLSPLLRRPVAYHLGWIDQDGTPTARTSGGKAVRPAIVLSAAVAVGAMWDQALPGAVALELVHDFSLLHDDVMDGDAERRHRPTVWAVFGTATAILAGDALLTLAHQALLADGSSEALRATEELDTATAEMVLGQAEDLWFESRPDVTVDECLAMATHKTGALIGCAGALGAILGGAGEAEVTALRAFGRHLGVAFQALDDILGIWGDPALTGKPAASDLRLGKKTLPLAQALTQGGRAAAALRSLWEAGPNPSSVAKAMAGLEEAKSRAWTTQVAERSLAAAMACLDEGSLRPEAVADLRAIAEFVTRRDH